MYTPQPELRSFGDVTCINLNLAVDISFEFGHQITDINFKFPYELDFSKPGKPHPTSSAVFFLTFLKKSGPPPCFEN